MNLVFIYGPPAAGKLTVATELAAATGYKLLDNHKAIDYLIEIFPRSETKYDKVRSRLGRQLRLDMFAAAAEAGVDLITTFAPLSPGTLDFMREVQAAVTGAGGTVLFVQLLPNRDALLARVTSESRKNRKIDTTERWHEVVAGNEAAFETFPDLEHCVIDNSDMSAAQAAQKVISYYSL
ncbi:MAG TPA: hypothetical protein VLH86_06135 [Patescibacteria group bacterium]|nr:hypothetical protein [Patescibacteria group bacterium]